MRVLVTVSQRSYFSICEHSEVHLMYVILFTRSSTGFKQTAVKAIPIVTVKLWKAKVLSTLKPSQTAGWKYAYKNLSGY